MAANIFQIKKSQIPAKKRKIDADKEIGNPISPIRGKTCAISTDDKKNCEYRNYKVGGDETHANMKPSSAILGRVNYVQTMKSNNGTMTQDTKIYKGPNGPKNLSTTRKPQERSGFSAPICKGIGKNNQIGTGNRNGNEEGFGFLQYTLNLCANSDKTENTNTTKSPVIDQWGAKYKPTVVSVNKNKLSCPRLKGKVAFKCITSVESIGKMCGEECSHSGITKKKSLMDPVDAKYKPTVVVVKKNRIPRSSFNKKITFKCITSVESIGKICGEECSHSGISKKKSLMDPRDAKYKPTVVSVNKSKLSCPSLNGKVTFKCITSVESIGNTCGEECSHSGTSKKKSLMDPVVAKYKPTVVVVKKNRIPRSSFNKKIIFKCITSVESIGKMCGEEELKLEETGTQDKMFTVPDDNSTVCGDETHNNMRKEVAFKDINSMKSIEEMRREETLKLEETGTRNIMFTIPDDMEIIENITPPPEFYFSDPVSSCEDLMNINITKEMSLMDYAEANPSDNIREINSINLIETEELKLEEKTSLRPIYISSTKRDSSSMTLSTYTNTDVSDNSLSLINDRLQNSMPPLTEQDSLDLDSKKYGSNFNKQATKPNDTPRLKINKTTPVNKISRHDSEPSAHVKILFKYSEARRCQMVQSPARDVASFCRLKQSQLIEATAATVRFLEKRKQPRRTHSNPISAYTLDICREPLQCPHMKCNKSVDFSKFIQHLIDHNTIIMERVSAGECKTAFLNLNVVNLEETICHAVFMVRDRLLDLTEGTYGDFLPIMIMSRWVHINEIIGNASGKSDDVIVDPKKDILLFIWPATIIVKEIPLKVSLTVWPIDGRCPDKTFCYVGEVFSLRTPPTIENLLNTANLIPLNAEQIQSLTSGGIQFVPAQFIVE